MESKEEERTSSNKKRDPPCLTELFQNQKEKKKNNDTNINHIHSMEIILQETADLYVMLLSEMLQLVYLQGSFYFHTLNNSVPFVIL